MTATIGMIALSLAAVLAGGRGMLPFLPAVRRRDVGICARWTAHAAAAEFFLITLAFAMLMVAFIDSDFSVLTVALNSHTAKPMLYKITGTWGNHEGSMLMWVWVLAIFGFLYTLTSTARPAAHMLKVMAVHGLITLGFLLYILLTSNPFARMHPVPEEGQGLNPLLQDIGLALHPPMLYLGYVGFAMTFCLAVAGLWEKKLDREWAQEMRPWSLLAWSLLTAGVGLGSWWAYRELGWGGWWFWDPVENVSLMPWLSGTVMLHAVAVGEKRGALFRWTAFLAILTFTLSLLGTFLVRSGLLTSVHAFASDPERGLFILGFISLVVTAALALFAWRAPQMGNAVALRAFSREGAILFGALLLLTMLAIVFLGTLYPLILDAIGLGRISVGPPYYNATFLPLTLPLMALAAAGPLIAWKRGTLPPLLRALRVPAALALIVLLALALGSLGDHSAWYVLGILGIAFGALLAGAMLWSVAQRIQLFHGTLAASGKRLRQLPMPYAGMVLAHLGFAFLAMGAATLGIGQEQTQRPLAVGDHLQAGPYTATLEQVTYDRGPNFLARRAHLALHKGDTRLTTLYPEGRYYVAEDTRTAEARAYQTLFYEVYAVLGEMDETGLLAVRLYYNPLVHWLWFGCLLLTAGGLCSACDGFRKLAAAPRPATEEAPA